MSIQRSTILLAGLGIAALGMFLFVNRSDSAPRGARPAPLITVTTDAVSAGGLTLVSTHMALPDDSESYPPGPNADIVNADCLACHSASMVLYQPSLSAAEWRKEVEKMRDAYGAPVADADIPAIVAYLSATRESSVK
jgi:hypothetical protein